MSKSCLVAILTATVLLVRVTPSVAEPISIQVGTYTYEWPDLSASFSLPSFGTFIGPRPIGRRCVAAPCNGPGGLVDLSVDIGRMLELRGNMFVEGRFLEGRFETGVVEVQANGQVPFTFFGRVVCESGVPDCAEHELTGTGYARSGFLGMAPTDVQYFFQPVAPVPEPGTLSLLAGAVTALTAKRVCRRRRPAVGADPRASVVHRP